MTDPGSTGATVADDSFHAPADADPFWTETAWFGFNVPERRIAGAIYPVFRPNQGICSAGVYVWDHTGVCQHEILYARNWWHLPMPAHDLVELSLPIGLRYDTVEPLTTYRVRFDDPDELQLDLTFDAVHEPHAPITGATGHLDQVCRVQGRLRLHGEEIEVDSYDMRDRSWSVRKDTGAVRAGYDYGVAVADGRAGEVFLAMSVGGGDEQPVLAGYHFVDGQVRRVTGGRRTVERDRGRPVAVRVEVTDDAGVNVTATSDLRNQFAFQSSPNYFAWMSLTDWTVGDAVFRGQSQDVWSPDLLRAEQRGRQA